MDKKGKQKSVMGRPTLWLVLAVLIVGIIACGAKTEEDSATATGENAGSTQSSTAADDKTIENGQKNEEVEIAFEELTVIDNAECVIKITGINPENIWGYSLDVYLENKSAEKTYMYSIRGASVNGVESDPLFASEVASGKKANETISFSDSELRENGIDKFTDIELFFYVYDSNDWGAEPVAEKSVHVYPYGEDKAETFIREVQSTDNVIIDNDNVRVIVTGYEEDDIWGYTVNLFLENKTDKEVMFSVDEVAVNGYMADPFFASTVLPGKCKFTSMSWSDTSFEENNITEVEEIEMVFRAYNSEEFMADDYARETIVLNP